MKGKKIFILGAGGVVPSIIFALNKMNVSKIIISNRTKKKAEDLKSQFHSLEILDWGDINDFDVIINATSLGLNNEKINLDFSKFGNNKLFYDVIYNPVETNFLKEGKKLGNKTENGKLMFIYQAFEAFKLWHGIEPQINSETLEILKMIRIGILGNIGSGKSYVAKNFGYPVFNADYEVSKLYKKDKKIFKKLKKKLPKYISSFPINKNEITKAILKKRLI